MGIQQIKIRTGQSSHVVLLYFKFNFKLRLIMSDVTVDMICKEIFIISELIGFSWTFFYVAFYELNSDFRWVHCTLFYMAVFVGWNQNFNIVKDNVRWFIETWPSVNSRTNTREFTYMYDHLSSMYKKI